MATILKIYFSSIMIFIPFGLCLIHFNCESGYNFTSNHGHATWMSLIRRVSETIIKNRSNSQRINCVRVLLKIGFKDSSQITYICHWTKRVHCGGGDGVVVAFRYNKISSCMCVCLCLCLTCVHFYTIYAVTCDKVSTYNNVVRPTRRNVPSSLSHPLVGLLCLISFF